MVRVTEITRMPVRVALAAALAGLTACSWVGGSGSAPAPSSHSPSASSPSPSEARIDAVISELQQMRDEDQKRLDQQQQQI